MFKHILLGWMHQYRNIETGGEEAAAGDVTEQPAENADATQSAENAETHQQANDGYPEGTPDWVKKRMSELSRQKREEKQRNDELSRRLQELETRQTQASPDQIANMDQDQLQQYVEALANQRAKDIARQNSAQSAKEQRWQTIENTGRESHGDEFFNSARRLQEHGATSQNLVGALEEMDEAADVLMYLGQLQNIDEAARIAALPPVKMAMELAKLGPKAKTELKKARQTSKAPAPIDPLGGNGGAPNIGKEPPTNSPDWFAWRNKQVAARRG